MKVNLTQEEINNIVKQESEMLATTIATHRVLGSFADEAKVAMYELLRRKIQEKSDFDFETSIAETIKQSKIELKVPKFQDLKRSFYSNMVQSLFQNNFTEENEEAEEEPAHETQKDNAAKLDPQQEKDMMDVYNELKRILEEE